MKVFSAVESWTRVPDLDTLANLLAVKCSHTLPGLKELKRCFVLLYYFSFLGTRILNSQVIFTLIPGNLLVQPFL